MIMTCCNECLVTHINAEIEPKETTRSCNNKDCRCHMQTKYFPDAEFVKFIKDLGDRAQLKVIEGKFRWVIDDEYIARPQEANEA